MVATLVVYSIPVLVALIARLFFIPRGKVIIHVFDFAPAQHLVKMIANAETMQEKYSLYNMLVRLEAKFPAVIMDYDKTVDDLIDEELKRTREKFTTAGKIKDFIAGLTVRDEEREPRYTYLRDVAHDFLTDDSR
ncbi:hypothetical protein [Pyrococcus kukulkanii]|uniref:Uncharacterized protein n=1 Tax=Pyrococcus kukulkanii TaxID=1609559 RepID=A0ABV4T8R7_9EURY